MILVLTNLDAPSLQEKHLSLACDRDSQTQYPVAEKEDIQQIQSHFQNWLELPLKSTRKGMATPY